MPKRRGGDAMEAGASGGGGGGGVSAGAGTGAALASGLVDRDVRVQSWSHTRGQMEDLVLRFTGPERAFVRSYSGNVYETTTDSCTCPGHVMRRRICRHIAGVRSALGIGGGVAAAPTVRHEETAAPAAAEARSEEAAQVVAARSDEDRLADEARARWEELQRHDDTSLEDDETFRRLYDTALRGEVVYERENVLGGTGVTFGVEIEFVGGDANAIARDLHAAGLIPAARRERYHSPRRSGMWAFETDGSVSTEYSGGEVVSPPLSDTPEAWTQLERICEIIRRHGGSVDRQCGAHVHVSHEPLDANRHRWTRLIRLAGGYEDLLYRLASGGEATGGRHRGTGYAVPGIASRVSRRFDSDREARQTLNLSGGRYSALNYRANTVEFRHFNGTLDPRRIQANVRLAHAMVMAARTLQRRNSRSRFVPSQGMPHQSVTDDANHTHVRRLADALFTRAADKVALLWLYATGNWPAASSRRSAAQ